MHRIDTPTAQADKFGPGKNGFTNGDPATGRRATDLNSDMWDAVQEEICTVVEKAGLALNKDQHDQLHQAIVKIITSKIPDALLKKNNLSDVVDKALALANLGGVPKTLKVNGLELQKDINIIPSDIYKLSTGIGDAADLNTFTTPGLYYQPANAQAATGKNYPEPNAGSLEVYKHAGITQVYRVYNNSRHYIRTLYSGTWTAWAWVYDTAHKPSASDVGALPITGGTVTGGVTVNDYMRTGRSRIMEISSSNTSTLNGLINLWGNVDRPTVMEFKDATGYHFYSQRNKDGSVSFKFNGAAGFGAGITSGGEIISRAANGLRIAYGNFGTFWRNDGSSLYLMLTNSGDPLGNYNSLRPFTVNLTNGDITINKLALANFANFDARYYTKSQSDAGYMPKTGAYTKGESDARYPLKTATVIDVRMGSPGTIVLKGNAWNYVPAGCAFTGWYVEGSAPVDDTIQYKPVQININGSWRTISG
ncbi:hypothetical protein ACOILA_002444 [Cronobacter sakazakii]|uniref:pyocin knob domain-containing protein n=1 Tax=Cronobacter sakazakii TaxID=28141 RepID=UPI00192A64FD|nr:pyocin knob domain-containing protein [Cronobacter sakazakii]ELY2674485.1 hypothetical protein [Cronobacter sakazakii]ELY2749688.1 hypothetical protein [Cronobacter sakazakii]ELY2905302.1 hypothetical protein [Cronobacter sakazakii]ELY4433842.1 hypothetical protein [Cronobacter sakazakii]ELY4586946.1 hypothetical protein [Cronobacter sakazakii]